MGRNQTSIHTSATLSSGGAQAITGLGEVEVVLVVNVTVPPTGGSPTLQYTLQGVDPGNNSSPYGSPVATSSIVASGVYMATLPKIDGDVLVSWAVSGGSFTGVFATILLGPVSAPSTIGGTVTTADTILDATVSGGNVKVAVQGSVTTTGPVRTNITGSALEAGHVLKASAGTFISLACEIDPTAPTASYYLLLIDSATVPVDGAVTLLASIGVEHVIGTRDYPNFTADQGGIPFTTGLVLVLSTTRPTKTAAGSYLWLSAASVS